MPLDVGFTRQVAFLQIYCVITTSWTLMTPNFYGNMVAQNWR
jgi:hypothetical protein